MCCDGIFVSGSKAEGLPSMKRRIAVTVLASAVFACGGSSTSPGSRAPSAAQACADLGNAECTRLATCSPIDMILRYGDTATCMSRVTANCTTSLAAPSTGNSPAHTEACSQAYPGWSCTGLFERPQRSDGLPAADRICGGRRRMCLPRSVSIGLLRGRSGRRVRHVCRAADVGFVLRRDHDVRPRRRVHERHPDLRRRGRERRRLRHGTAVWGRAVVRRLRCNDQHAGNVSA